MRIRTDLFKKTPATSESSQTQFNNYEQLRILERQMFESNERFDEEPHFYAWCAACTPYDNKLFETILIEKQKGSTDIHKIAQDSVSGGIELIARANNGDQEALFELAERGRATFSPISGEVKQIYSLCDRINSQGQCPLFEQKKVE
jgi:hypothetical protein